MAGAAKRIVLETLGWVLLLLGVMLEPRAVRRGKATVPLTTEPLTLPPGERSADPLPSPFAEPATMAAPRFVPVHERSSVKEVVESSRQRRARRARSATVTTRRTRRPATEG